jgi:hypothetical protein
METNKQYLLEDVLACMVEFEERERAIEEMNRWHDEQRESAWQHQDQNAQ